MLNNDVLRSLHYLLDLPDAHLAELAAPFGGQVEIDLLGAYLKREDEDDFQACPDRCLTYCLGRLIIQRRGRDKSRSLPPLELSLNNDMILKKLRVAFELKEENLHVILTSADFPASKPELSTLSHRPGHNNYRTCGDQSLRNFLRGLTLCVRG